MNRFFRFKQFFNFQSCVKFAGAVGIATFFSLHEFGIKKSISSATSAKRSHITDLEVYTSQPKSHFQQFINSFVIFTSKNVLIFSGNANQKLAAEICRLLKTNLGQIQVSKFTDGEVNIQVLDNVRGKDIYIIQPTCSPVNDNLMELLLLISTMKRASARKINAVIPYYGYSRQDRKCAPRVPISAADVARLLATMGVDRVISVDLHCGQIQGFFPPSIPVDNLEANRVALDYFIHSKQFNLKNIVIVSPDAGGVARAKKFQELLKHSTGEDAGLAMIIKHRDQPGSIAMMHLVGEVKNKDAIIIDDMIDTAGTLAHAVDELKKKGAQKVCAFATHGLFSGEAFKNINNSQLDKVVVTNTIPIKQNEESATKIQRLSVAPLLAEAIKRIQQKESVSILFRPDLENK